MNGEQTINFNSQCFSHVSHWSYTHYINFCNGKTYDVPNGFWDYFLDIVLAVGLVGIVLLILFGLFKLCFDDY